MQGTQLLRDQDQSYARRRTNRLAGRCLDVLDLPYDRVLVEMSPYDLARGRIPFRYRN
jgi:translation initiation factor IF-1